MIILFSLNIAAGLLIVASVGYSLKLSWNPTRCQHPGCKEPGIFCFVDYGRNTPEYAAFYCWNHAGQYGFCKICGSFWGGIESFEFHHPDICDFCWDEIHDDFDYDDPSYYDDSDYDDPHYLYPDIPFTPIEYHSQEEWDADHWTSDPFADVPDDGRCGLEDLS